MEQKAGFLSWEEDLTRKMKNPKFRKGFEEAKTRFQATYQITVLRHKKRMTQKQLAKKMKMKQAAVARIEAGEQNLTIETLQKFARAFGKKLQIKFV